MKITDRIYNCIVSNASERGNTLWWLLNDDLIKTIFDNVGNSGLAALVMYTGYYFYYDKYPKYYEYVKYLSLPFIAVGFFLYFINIDHGLKKIVQYSKNKCAVILLSIIYPLMMMCILAVIMTTKRTDVMHYYSQQPSQGTVVQSSAQSNCASCHDDGSIQLQK